MLLMVIVAGIFAKAWDLATPGNLLEGIGTPEPYKLLAYSIISKSLARYLMWSIIGISIRFDFRPFFSESG